MDPEHYEAIWGTNTAPGSAGQNGVHTPGPWIDEMELPMATRQVSAFGKDGNRVLCIRIQSFNLDADARLIAAAPQMLEALRVIAEYPPAGAGRRTRDGYPAEVVYDEYAYRRIVDSYRSAARTAIAAATGEEG